MLIKPSCKHIKDKNNFCSICFRKQVFMSYKTRNFKDYFFGSAPSPFIGRHNYPDINVGILNLDFHDEKAKLYDDPREWAKKNYSISDVAKKRVALINSRTRANIKSQEKISEITQLVGLSKKPVEMEINLARKPKAGFNYDFYSAPSGPKAILKKAKITENVKIDSRLEKVHSDVDLKVADALSYLQSHGFDENKLSQSLSVGAFGKKINRKLVPTRWSITATDDMLGKNLIQKIKDFKETDFLAYFGGYLGNYYLVLLIPGIWSFELFEIITSKDINPWSKKQLKYSTDFESFQGRKEYANETVGGYYASRLGIAELLNNMKRQASVLVFRFIKDSYSMPLGVWVVREATRKAIKVKPLEFGSKELLINYARVLAKKKFNIDLDTMLDNSKLLNEQKLQKRLFDF